MLAAVVAVVISRHVHWECRRLCLVLLVVVLGALLMPLVLSERTFDRSLLRSDVPTVKNITQPFR